MLPRTKEGPGAADVQRTHGKNMGNTSRCLELDLVEAATKELNIQDLAHICKKTGLEKISDFPSAANDPANGRGCPKALYLYREARFLFWRKREPDGEFSRAGEGASSESL